MSHSESFSNLTVVANVLVLRERATFNYFTFFKYVEMQINFNYVIYDLLLLI